MMLKRTRVLKSSTLQLVTVSCLYKNAIPDTPHGIGKERGTYEKSAELDNNTI